MRARQRQRDKEREREATRERTRELKEVRVRTTPGGLIYRSDEGGASSKSFYQKFYYLKIW